jgi:two-component system nitrogen regulation sensor histidine kinase NtrY
VKLRTRITLAMLALVITSLLVIGGVTVWFFAEQNQAYHQERLERKERAIKTDMAYFSKEVQVQEDQDIVVKEFEQELLRLATVHQLEINIFNTQGEMLVAAKPDSIHSDYFDKRVPVPALEELQELDRIIIPEQEGMRRYLSDYTNLYNRQGVRIAILHIPYLQDRSINQQDLEKFLGSIGAVYLLIFLAGIALTFYLSRSITRNLSALSERMQHVDLNGVNEPFDWHSDDEVGAVVDAYNAMLAKLEESRMELTKTERESAWREMARQVAHEIKNPLTPIKLSVQHLMATAAYDDPEWRSKFLRTMHTIIQQIETLSNIASEFSDFAQMPKSNASIGDVREAIKSIVNLYAEVPVSLEVSLPDEALMVWIDQEQFGRVLNNLVKNAKHAVEGVDRPSIAMTARRRNGKIEVTVEDNGIGIPKSDFEKIFRPNFTTKSSGTGLGLAICKQIVESAGGRISFQSEAGIYTRFILQLPEA